MPSGRIYTYRSHPDTPCPSEDQIVSVWWAVYSGLWRSSNYFLQRQCQPPAIQKTPLDYLRARDPPLVLREPPVLRFSHAVGVEAGPETDQNVDQSPALAMPRRGQNQESTMLTNLNPSGNDEDRNKELLADETFTSNFLWPIIFLQGFLNAFGVSGYSIHTV